MKQTALLLYEMLCIREGIFEFCHDRNFLIRSQVDEIIAFLACERSSVVYCTLLTAHFTLAQCTLLCLMLMLYLQFVVLSVRFSIINKYYYIGCKRSKNCGVCLSYSENRTFTIFDLILKLF